MPRYKPASVCPRKHRTVRPRMSRRTSGARWRDRSVVAGPRERRDRRGGPVASSASTPLGSLLRTGGTDSVRDSITLTLSPNVMVCAVVCRSMVFAPARLRRRSRRCGRSIRRIRRRRRGASVQPGDGRGHAPDRGGRCRRDDFAGVATLVDVGGGYGALIPPVLAGASGNGRDRVRSAPVRAWRKGVVDRCRVE